MGVGVLSRARSVAPGAADVILVALMGAAVLVDGALCSWEVFLALQPLAQTRCARALQLKGVAELVVFAAVGALCSRKALRPL